MSAPITVVDWLDEEGATDREEAVGGMGGWVEGEPWAEYLAAWPPEDHPYLEALKAEILAKGIRWGGFWHQGEGTPLFSDGKVASFSMRGWGDLLASVWSEHDGEPQSYCRYAWYGPGEQG